MRPVRRLAVLILAGGLAACAPTVAATPATLAPTRERPVEVVVERDGDRWTAEFVLDRDAPVWAFTRSALALTLVAPGPRRVALVFCSTPRTGDRP